MSPKIDPIQSLAPGPNGHISIKGPLGDWDPDVIAVVITVVVSQVITTNGSTQIATAIGWSVQYTGAGNWSANTPAVGATPLQPGGAMVAAWATIARKDGGYEMYEWTLPVKFV
jgi:hypothetical protein